MLNVRTPRSVLVRLARPRLSQRFTSSTAHRLVVTTSDSSFRSLAARALPVASLAVALSASIAFAAPNINMTDSPEAVLAEERFNDPSYDRTTLLEDLKTAYAANPEDVGVMWRLSRAAYEVSELKKTPKDDEKKLIYYAYDLIQKALAKTEEVAEVHNWYGIILSRIGDFEGTKVAIANSYKIKSHWERSVELKPSHPTTYHLLGRWCMTISDLSWIERKAAAVLFGSPPESSYNEALTYLLKCEELRPGDWKKNSMLIAQVYYKKKDWAKAKEWTEKTLAVPIESEEDETVHEEATALLKKF